MATSRKQQSEKRRAKDLARQYSILPVPQPLAAGTPPPTARQITQATSLPIPGLGMPFRKRHPDEKDDSDESPS